MLAIACVLLLVAGMGLAGFFLQRHKAGRIGKTPVVSTLDAKTQGEKVAGERGAISVQGAMQCAAPVISPVTQTPCAYFETVVTASWKVGEEKREAPISEVKKAALITIDDGSGPVAVVLGNLSGDDDYKQVFSKSRKMGLLNVMEGHNLKFGDKGYTVLAGTDSSDGRRVPSDAEYTVIEKILPVLGEVYVAGKAEGGKIVAPNWVSLTVSSKSRDELLAKTAVMMKRTKIASIATGPAGVVLMVVAMALGKGPGAHAAVPPAAKLSIAPSLTDDAPVVQHDVAEADTAPAAQVKAPAPAPMKKKGKR